MLRRSADRAVALIARGITHGLYRSVEVIGFEDLDRDRPILIVANHFNGFVDPVVVTGVLGRLPRFIAKSTSWEVPLLPAILATVGVLPVHRQVDGGGDNHRIFAEVVARLSHGEMVAIFPEGTTHDDPHLAPVRTGAARLALEAHQAGVLDLAIVPVGVTFEDKVALRSRVVIRMGRPICDGDPFLDRLLADAATDEDHRTVRILTDEIRDRLAEVSPNFSDNLSAIEMRGTADAVLRDAHTAPLAEVSLAERETVAAELDTIAEPSRSEVGRALAEYRLLLADADITDEVLAPLVDLRTLANRLIATAVMVALLAPFAFVGIVANVVPAALVTVAGTFPKAPVSKGTVRLLVGLVAFPAAWTAIAVFDIGTGLMARIVEWFTLPLTPVVGFLFDDRSGWGSSLFVFVCSPALGLLAVWLAEQASRLLRTWRAMVTNINRRNQIDELLARRADLVALTMHHLTARRSNGQRSNGQRPNGRD